MIELDHLSVRYSASNGLALSDISLTIADGEYVAVMGENGSGKSTLVRTFNGLLLPAEGKVIVDGWSTREPSRLRSIRESVGIVFQNPRMQTTSLTVEREIAFGLQNIGIPVEEIGVRVDQQLASSGLTPLRRQFPRMLSGGEQQRLALGAILAMRPRHLILDEATSLLSPSSRAALLRRVSEERRWRVVTVVLVTQFAEEALRADRLVILHRGRIVFDGIPQEVLAACAAAGLGGIPVPRHLPAGRRA